MEAPPLRIRKSAHIICTGFHPTESLYFLCFYWDRERGHSKGYDIHASCFSMVLFAWNKDPVFSHYLTDKSYFFFSWSPSEIPWVSFKYYMNNSFYSLHVAALNRECGQNPLLREANLEHRYDSDFTMFRGFMTYLMKSSFLFQSY